MSDQSGTRGLQPEISRHLGANALRKDDRLQQLECVCWLTHEKQSDRGINLRWLIPENMVSGLEWERLVWSETLHRSGESEVVPLKRDGRKWHRAAILKNDADRFCCMHRHRQEGDGRARQQGGSEGLR